MPRNHFSRQNRPGIANLFAAYGIPEHVVSDNSPQLILEEFMKGNCIVHIRSSPHLPSTNGFQTFERAMQASENNGRPSYCRLVN